jgi:hypothetical protein
MSEQRNAMGREINFMSRFRKSINSEMLARYLFIRYLVSLRLGMLQPQPAVSAEVAPVVQIREEFLPAVVESTHV